MASRTSCFSIVIFLYPFLCTVSKLFINNQRKFRLFIPDVWTYFTLEIDIFILDTYFRNIKFSRKYDYFHFNNNKLNRKQFFKKRVTELWSGPIIFSSRSWCDHVVQRFLAPHAIITALIHSVQLKP